MDLGLTGRAAVITGGSKGIGRAVALALARERARVAICARGRAELEEAAREVEAEGSTVYAAPADVTRAEEVEQFIAAAAAALGGIDILVNNAGRAQPGRFAELTDEQWEADLRVKLLSQVRCTRAALPYLERSPCPRVINVNAIVGRVTAPGLMATATNRAACLAFSKSLAQELAPRGILVNSVNVGYVRTPQWENIRRHLAPEASLEEFLSRIAAQVPLGRVGRPEEVAAVVVFLASARSSYVTGASIDVGGGFGAHV